MLSSFPARTLWCRGLARHPFKVKIAGSNPARVATPPFRGLVRLDHDAAVDHGPQRLCGGDVVLRVLEQIAVEDDESGILFGPGNKAGSVSVQLVDNAN